MPSNGHNWRGIQIRTLPLAVLAVLWVYRSISVINQAVHSFFLAMSRHDLDYIYGHLATSISSDSKVHLGALLFTNVFADYKKARWISHSSSPSSARMEGYIIMKS